MILENIEAFIDHMKEGKAGLEAKFVDIKLNGISRDDFAKVLRAPVYITIETAQRTIEDVNNEPEPERDENQVELELEADGMEPVNN